MKIARKPPPVAPHPAKKLRYISPTPNGFLIRITRAISPVFAKTEAEAIVKRAELFEQLFRTPYSEEAATSFSYSTNKGSDRRGVEFVKLKSGKEFWQVKLKDPPDQSGVSKTRIRKFFVSKWGRQAGYLEAVKCKDANEVELIERKP